MENELFDEFKTKALVVTVEEITPERAADWLENHNRRNRPLSEQRAKALAREMTEGRWRINTTAPISLTPEGELVDGQHRLRAVVIAGVPVVMTVSRWASPDDFQIIDLGRRRSVADTFAVEGIRSYASLASAIEYYLSLHASETVVGNSTSGNNTFSRDDKLEEYHSAPEFWDRAIAFAVNLYNCGTRVLTTKLTGAFYGILCKDRGHDPATVEEFLRGVDSGKSDCLSVRKMHSILCRCKGEPNTMANRTRRATLLAKAWNNYLAGRNGVNLIVGPNEIVTLK